MNLQKIPFKLLIKTKVVQAFLNQTFDRDPNQSRSVDTDQQQQPESMTTLFF